MEVLKFLEPALMIDWLLFSRSGKLNLYKDANIASECRQFQPQMKYVTFFLELAIVPGFETSNHI